MNTLATAVDGRQYAQPTHVSKAVVKAVYGLLAVVLLGYLVSLMLRSNGVTWTWLDGWGVDGFELFVSLLVLVSAAANRRYRRFAVVLGTGMLFWAAGDVAMTIETLHGASAPTVSVANYLWAGFYPFAYVAMMMLIREEAKKLTPANYLDGVMAGLAAAAVFVAFAFGATRHAAGGSTLGVAVNLIYPMGDVLLFVLVLLGIVLAPLDRRRRWVLIGAACLVNTSGDVCALFPGLLASHIGFADNAIAWSVSLLLLSYAAWRSPAVPREQLDEMKPGFRLSGVASGSALVVLLFACVSHTDRAGLVLATATLAVAGVRFSLSLRQLHALNAERHRQLLDAARVAAEFSAQVADGASHQSTSLNETTRTVDEVRVAANDTALKATTVAQRARDSVRVSDEGAHAMAKIADAMEDIREGVGNTAHYILTLSEHTEQIGDITRTVRQLAERSKLLALNATIEAARAGDHGKGFAVVADEVRNLSERSQEATRQVETVLGQIRDATSAAVIASNDGTEVVEQGLRLTGLAAEVIRSLTDTIREASGAAHEIAASAQQESIGMDQIASSMNSVNGAAEQLSELSRRLANLGGTPEFAHVA